MPAAQVFSRRAKKQNKVMFLESLLGTRESESLNKSALSTKDICFLCAFCLCSQKSVSIICLYNNVNINMYIYMVGLYTIYIYIYV